MIPEMPGDLGASLPDDNPIWKFLVLVLWQAWKDNATEVVIEEGTATQVPIRYSVEGKWCDMSGDFPPKFRPQLARLALEMAGAKAFPVTGEILVEAGGIQMSWRLTALSAEAALRFSRGGH